MRTLVLGLGNPILTDDGIGIHVVRAVASHPVWQGLVAESNFDGVDLAEASVGGLRLLEQLAGYDRVLLVDAIQASGGRPGEACWLRIGDLRTSLHSGSSHDLTLSGALALGRQLGMQLPEEAQIAILAIEVEDLHTFGERCTPQVETAIPLLAQMVIDEMRRTQG